MARMQRTSSTKAHSGPTAIPARVTMYGRETVSLGTLRSEGVRRCARNRSGQNARETRTCVALQPRPVPRLPCPLQLSCIEKGITQVTFLAQHCVHLPARDWAEGALRSTHVVRISVSGSTVWRFAASRSTCTLAAVGRAGSHK